jgi:hypothetical protein
VRGRGERQCSPPRPENTVDAKWSIRLTPLEPYLRIGLSGHGLPRLPNPALFYQGLANQQTSKPKVIIISTCPLLPNVKRLDFFTFLQKPALSYMPFRDLAYARFSLRKPHDHYSCLYSHYLARLKVYPQSSV